MLRSVLRDTSDNTQLYLISANKTEEDILCRAEIDALCAQHSGRFRVHYALSATVPDGWAYSVGRVTEAMIRKYLPEPGEGKLVLACGPQPMIDGVLKGGMKWCGWNVDTDLVVF